MSLSDVEQYLLELMNRARLDPAAEAERMGINLNAGLRAGQITEASKQVLAPNGLVEAAATGHAQWILATDSYTHIGLDGTMAGQRIKLEGYDPNAWAENLGLQQVVPGQSAQVMIEALNRSMFLSASQRLSLMRDDLREAGVAVETGVYTQAGNNFDVQTMAVNLASTAKERFLTGVAYGDSNGDGFYSLGEGASNVVFTVGGVNATTASAGGYALAVSPLMTSAAVTGRVGAVNFDATVDMTAGNVKLDLVSGATFHTSGSIVLGAGVNNVQLLGLNALNATGNAVGNVLNGNSGNNDLTGLAGNDVINGYAGRDTILGGAANDKINGGKGSDDMTGGQGRDTFIFTAGCGDDQVTDFSIAGGDKLRLDDSLWAGLSMKPAGIMAQFAVKGVGEVYLDFGEGDIIHLVGLTTAAGLGTVIEIY